MAVRVLVLTKTLGIGGAENLVAGAVTADNRTDVEYEVAYVLSSYGGLAGGIRREGVAVHDLGARGNYDLGWLWRLRALLLGRDFGVVHTHLPYAAAWARLVVRSLPRRRRPKLVYTQHCDWGSVALPIRMLSRLTIGFDDAILAVSGSTRDAMPTAARRRAEVVVHGIDIESARRSRGSRSSVRKELGIAPTEALVIAVGNLRAEKGYDVLLDSVQLLVRRGVRLRVAVAGAGPLAAQLRARQERHGLGDVLCFLGNRDDALRLIAGADVFVLSSTVEGLPLALMEALVIGTPVVATAVGGVPDVIEDGCNGRLVPPARADLLADAIADLLTDEQTRKRLARAGEETSGGFDVRVANARIEAIYRELVGR